MSAMSYDSPERELAVGGVEAAPGAPPDAG
jgi:hypothetical protein